MIWFGKMISGAFVLCLFSNYVCLVAKFVQQLDRRSLAKGEAVDAGSTAATHLSPIGLT